jgi:hypothetical protein
MLRPPAEFDVDNRTRRDYFHNVAYAGSDVDLFLYGLDEAAGLAKLDEVFKAVVDACPHEVIAIRSAFAINIVSQYPYRHVQIVLRLYSSPAEILMGFDVDSCAVGFDGKRAWAACRAHNAITSQVNAVDMTRRSPSYESRLAKYAKRGFEVAVPGLQRSRVDPMIFERAWSNVNGLAKLLLLEKLTTPEARFEYKERHRAKKVRCLSPACRPPLCVPYSSHCCRLWLGFAFKQNRRSRAKNTLSYFRDQWLSERAEASFGADASDYSVIFIPWGPKWNAKKIAKTVRPTASRFSAVVG